MPRTTFYARTDPRLPDAIPGEHGVEWQLLADHLKNVAELAAGYAGIIKPDDTYFISSAWWAGVLHDLGKYKHSFQRLLYDSVTGKPLKKSPHSIYGSALSAHVRAYHIALSIMGHHSGLKAASELKTKISPEKLKLAETLYAECLVNHDAVIKNSSSIPPAMVVDNNSGLKLDLQIRMLFSCLVDADRTDSYRFENGPLTTSTLKADKLFRRLMNVIEGKSKNGGRTKVNDIRKKILDACLEAAPHDDKLFSLTVPTGSGKTLSSMAFALKKAALNKDTIKRIIVVIPFLSIIEQNADVYIEALGRENIFEHHSGDLKGLKEKRNGAGGRYSPDSDQEEVDAFASDVAEHNWDAPVIITTSVRFFESLFSNHPRDLRRLHNIANSIVILDEVQTLPKYFLLPLLSMMKGLSEDWNTTFLFCTATQPAFEKQEPSISGNMRWAPGTIRPVIDEGAQKEIFSELQRVQEAIWPGEDETISWEELSALIVRERRALCIVNTKIHALELYEKTLERSDLEDIPSSSVFHLSTRMCPKHRLKVIEDIKTTLWQPDKPCLVISTQLVEAGVELDFPVVFRAMGPLDAVIQAAGRCDREGKLTAAAGKPAGRVVVFTPEEDRSPYMRETAITRGMARLGGLSIHNPLHVKRYFDEVYSGDGDVHDIEGLRKQLDFPEVAERFFMIDDRTRAVLVPYDEEAETLIKELYDCRKPYRELMRKLQRFQVGLYPHEFNRAYKKGLIYELWEGADIWVCLKEAYSKEIGFQIDINPAEEFLSA